jgi:hypothetical protein
MKCKCTPLLALVLAIALATVGCSAQSISVALEDLPVLTQTALNIATLVSTLASGQQASTADVAVIQNISAQASRDLNLMQTLYNEYKSNPRLTTLEKIQNVVADLNQNLPTRLQAAHMSNATLAARVTAAVNLDFDHRKQLRIAHSAACSGHSTHGFSKAETSLPHASDLKTQWNQQVCSASGNAAFNTALGDCVLR